MTDRERIEREASAMFGPYNWDELGPVYQRKVVDFVLGQRAREADALAGSEIPYHFDRARSLRAQMKGKA